MNPAPHEEEVALMNDSTINDDAATNRPQAPANQKSWLTWLCSPLGQLLFLREDAAIASNDRWWRKIFPLGRHCLLTDAAFGSCLETIASAMVTAVLTLNIYSATYFLAWAKDNSGCTIKLNPDANVLSATGIPDNLKAGLKIAAVGLPFAFVPLTLCVSGMAKAAEKSGRGLGVVAGLILGELSYVMILGGFMTVCMSEKSYKVVGAITLGLLACLLWIWGCAFKHPKVLRGCVYPSCCCPKYEDEDLDLEAAAGGGGRRRAGV